jgi:Spy/CpxP family protein refolding chaperone
MRHVLGLAGLAMMVALPVAAQAPGNGPGPGRRGEGMGPGSAMAPGRGDMAFAPARLLARNGELQLTAQQITTLTAIRDAARRATEAAGAQARRHMDELKVALDAPAPDTGAVRTHFLAAHEAMGQARLAMLVAGARAKGVLTDAQRTQVAAWHGRRSGGRWGPRRHPDGQGGSPQPPAR